MQSWAIAGLTLRKPKFSLVFGPAASVAMPNIACYQARGFG